MKLAVAASSIFLLSGDIYSSWCADKEYLVRYRLNRSAVHMKAAHFFDM